MPASLIEVEGKERLMDLESPAEREVAVHDHSHHVASAQLGRGVTANIGLERDVVHKVSRELQAIGKNQYAAAQDAQLDDFIPEAISTSDP